jgi:hypothetical protein
MPRNAEELTLNVPENYDFNEAAIRELVDSNHCPTEQFTQQSTGSTMELVCKMDRQIWPCPIITARRAWQEAQP